MVKVLLLLILLIEGVFAVDLAKCDKCSLGKEYSKCAYYVEMKGDRSYQESCRVYAQSLFENNSAARSSWFFLLAGDFDKAIEAGKIGVKVTEDYAAEQVAEAYFLKGDTKEARLYFDMLKKSHPKNGLFLEKHFEILSRLYPKKFQLQKVQKLLK
jgi:tetratricopeptide (TPR) repeat protein